MSEYVGNCRTHVLASSHHILRIPFARSSSMHRRTFLTVSAAAVLASGSSRVLAYPSTAPQSRAGDTQASSAGAAARIPRVQDAGTMRGEMLYRKLGATGIEVSVIGLGGSHLGQPSVTEDIPIGSDLTVPRFRSWRPSCRVRPEEIAMCTMGLR